MELGVTDPVPALNAPAVSHQLQQGFWGCAQAGEKQMRGMKGLAVTGSGGHHLDDPAGADPGLSDVLWGRLGTQTPGDLSAVADLVIRRQERDLALALELAADLAMSSVPWSGVTQEEQPLRSRG
ncbi:hypothetical protein H8F24_17770 [Synechococcus sp. CBW1002]|uniref:hypothetical protein n=1 Tax=Synechococcus sp. CBW1002 TaxID=1353134 RepID=UPI0018CFA1D7|nr:hypothetical protein [Synechococcus sp. CBW1002]QPN59765.1 hypothetical protein H8F24_17770 [Synechococcus sp. CBW1002]